VPKTVHQARAPTGQAAYRIRSATYWAWTRKGCCSLAVTWLEPLGYAAVVAARPTPTLTKAVGTIATTCCRSGRGAIGLNGSADTVALRIHVVALAALIESLRRCRREYERDDRCRDSECQYRQKRFLHRISSINDSSRLLQKMLQSGRLDNFRLSVCISCVAKLTRLRQTRVAVRREATDCGGIQRK
jgi:hypothetical protein